MNDAPFSSPIEEEKRFLRQVMRRRLAALDPGVRRADSHRLVAGIAALEVWREARRVALFAPTSTEPDIDLLWHESRLAGKECAYPVVTGKELHLFRVDSLESLRPVSPWNLREPLSAADARRTPGEMDLILVPGLAFDGEGRRLGRGGGYYDRLLALRANGRTALVGVGFGFQRLDKLPLASHDVRLDAVVFP